METDRGGRQRQQQQKPRAAGVSKEIHRDVQASAHRHATQHDSFPLAPHCTLSSHATQTHTLTFVPHNPHTPRCRRLPPHSTRPHPVSVKRTHATQTTHANQPGCLLPLPPRCCPLPPPVHPPPLAGQQSRTCRCTTTQTHGTSAVQEGCGCWGWCAGGREGGG